MKIQENRKLSPYAPGGFQIGEIETPTTAYIVKLWPADRTLMPSGLSGNGMVWYKVDPISNPPPIPIPVPVVEFERVYDRERIRVRVWEPDYAYVMEALLQAAALTAAGIGVGYGCQLSSWREPFLSLRRATPQQTLPRSV